MTASIWPASAQRHKLPPLSPEKVPNLPNAERSHIETIRYATASPTTGRVYARSRGLERPAGGY
jgi:hypothetical protein